MSRNKKIVDLTTIKEMLFGNERHLKEFADAALKSFGEFKENYTLFLTNRDYTNFRKAGHKIKPVAQMLGLTMILDEYEHAKDLILNEESDLILIDSTQKMNIVLDQVLKELYEVSSNT